MAQFEKSHPDNVAGPLFTDLTCIDCGTCFHLGPALFSENLNDDKSVVIKQPENLKEWREAKRAILSCPTNSIGVKGAPREFSETGTVLPFNICAEVFYLGYTSRSSFGATTYLIQREAGNVLVDSPKYNPALVKEIEKLGGVKWMFLSHQDDVADHRKFHEHFHCERIIHESDKNSDTKDCEIVLRGESSVELASDLKIIMTPGHTKGHMCLLYRNEYLFTGDHLFVDDKTHTLTASSGVSWYSWSHQVKSIEKLKNESFQWVLPGHGGWGKFSDGKVAIEILLEKLKGKR